jgi:hypothetical protein
MKDRKDSEEATEEPRFNIPPKYVIENCKNYLDNLI